jgi:catechol 2,3-dioxygenase-like lactoylglutathione lyase family enzyme
MSRVTMIQHINIQISDRERTREWYEKVLGAEFLDRGPELNSCGSAVERFILRIPPTPLHRAISR